LELTNTAADNFKFIGRNQPSLIENNSSVDESKAEGVTKACIHAILIFPDDKNLLSFDLAVSGD
jgi:hypothetical protein